MRSQRHPHPRPAPSSGFAGYRFTPEVITLAVRWYLRFGLSYRDVEELLAERGIEVDHVSIYRWVGVASFDGVSGRVIHHAAFGAPGVELSIRDGSVWVAQLAGNGALATGNLVRISAHTAAVAGKPLSLPVAPGFVAITSDALWTGALPARATPSLIRVDPNSGQTREVPLEGLPVDVVSLDDVVWVALRQSDKLVAIC